MVEELIFPAAAAAGRWAMGGTRNPTPKQELRAIVRANCARQIVSSAIRGRYNFVRSNRSLQNALALAISPPFRQLSVNARSDRFGNSDRRVPPSAAAGARNLDYIIYILEDSSYGVIGQTPTSGQFRDGEVRLEKRRILLHGAHPAS